MGSDWPKKQGTDFHQLFCKKSKNLHPRIGTSSDYLNLLPEPMLGTKLVTLVLPFGDSDVIPRSVQLETKSTLRNILV
ncbi:hypothetical protein L484_027378 [Morus notabilis]|uniref:Uncharacterized protein n=1 Tax=Morus notabilis TaxID=981085 RepID=W9QSE7_9ROSA|nr:hypothetical protein L484_027378 [Morus notabilis]